MGKIIKQILSFLRGDWIENETEFSHGKKIAKHYN